MIETIASIITAVATLGMVVVGGIALYTWKKEFIGKKKIELAAEIMETACDIQDLLIGARLDIYSPIELQEVADWMQSEKIKDPHNTDIYTDRFHFFIPHRRLEAGQDKIDRLLSFFNKAFLYWDKDIMKLITELHGYTVQIRQTAKALYYNEFPEKQHELEDIIFRNNADDSMTKRVNDIVEELRLNLEPLYKDRQTKWKKLKVGSKNV